MILVLNRLSSLIRLVLTSSHGPILSVETTLGFNCLVLCYLLLLFSAIRNGSSVHKLWNRIPPKYAWIHCR